MSQLSDWVGSFILKSNYAVILLDRKAISA